jgi:hypothetical protein
LNSVAGFARRTGARAGSTMTLGKSGKGENFLFQIGGIDGLNNDADVSAILVRATSVCRLCNAERRSRIREGSQNAGHINNLRGRQPTIRKGHLTAMNTLKITAGPFTFGAKLETEAAPKTCAAFLKHMPFKSQVVHVRWSGEGVWIPLGDLDFGVSYENHTSYPAPGQFILYPGGISETEILLAYGGVHFASKMGQLAGNHFITLTSGLENLTALGKMTLWKGAQDILFERA